MACEHCKEYETGQCVYPTYGMAPHRHENFDDINVSILLPKCDWPDNFREDEESPGLGVWTHCPNCGDSN